MSSTGKGGLVFGPGEKKKTKGLRQPNPMTVETFTASALETGGGAVESVPGPRGSGSQINSRTESGMDSNSFY